MDARDSKASVSGLSRRQFLLATGGVVPTVSQVIGEGKEKSPTVPGYGREASEKCTTIDLANYFNASAKKFGARTRPRLVGEEEARVGLVRVPGGKRSLRGIPFWLGSEDVEKKSWIVLSTQPGLLALKHVEIPLQRAAHYICLASFCDWDRNEAPLPGQDAFEQVGQVLANVILIYEDGSQHILPIRRRYETSSYVVQWDRLSAGCYAALPPAKPTATRLNDPLPHGTNWGGLQSSLRLGGPGGPGLDYLWVCALKNPQPERSVQALQLQAAGEDPWIVCGLTLFHRSDSPLRYEKLSLYRLTLPRPEAEEQDRWKLELDLGVIARTFTLPDFERSAWLSCPSAGLGEKLSPNDARFLYVELTASPAATLVLRDLKAGD